MIMLVINLKLNLHPKALNGLDVRLRLPIFTQFQWLYEHNVTHFFLIDHLIHKPIRQQRASQNQASSQKDLDTIAY